MYNDLFPKYLVTREGKVFRKFPFREVKGSLNTCGYLALSLGTRKKRLTKKVHAIVAETFLGPRPDGKHINHKDGDKLNNRVSNLEYVTHSQNTLHAYKLGLMTSRGERNSAAKLTEEQAKEIKYDTSGTAPVLLAKRYGVSRSTVYNITSGCTWKHI